MVVLCPECLSVKPFWALRCHSCNEEIGFFRQLFSVIVFYTGLIIGLIGILFVVSLFG